MFYGKGILALGALFILLVFGSGCMDRTGERSEVVKITMVRSGCIEDLIKAQGTVKPRNVTNYFAPAIGTLTYLSEDGARVTTGEKVVEIETSEIDREIESYENEKNTLLFDMDLKALDNKIKACRFENEVQLKKAELKVSQAKLEQKQTAIKATEAKRLDREIINLTNKLQRIETEIKEKTPFLQKGFVSKEELAQLKHDLETGTLELEIAKKDLAIVYQGTPHEEILDARMEVKLAETSLKQAEIRLKRFMEVREVELKNYSLRIADHDKEISRLKDKRSKMTWFAPHSGTVMRGKMWKAGGMVTVNEGELLGTGFKACTLSQASDLKLTLELHESVGSRVTTGCKVTFAPLAYPESTFEGTISSVKEIATYRQWDLFKTKWIAASVDIDEYDSRLRTGMSVLSDIVIGSRNGLLIPTQAINDKNEVTLATGDIVTVRTGQSTYTETEIIQGLKEGDNIEIHSPPLYPAGAKRKKVAARKGTIRIIVEGEGEIIPGKERPIAIKLAPDNRIKLNTIAQEGATVQKGDVIATADNISANNTLREKKLSFSLANKELTLARENGKLDIDKLTHALSLAQLDRRISELSRDILIEGNPHTLEEQRLELLMVKKELEGIERQLSIKREMSQRGYASDKDVITLKEKLADVEKRRDVAALRFELTRQGPTKLERAKEDLLVAKAVLAENMARKTLELNRDRLKTEERKSQKAIEHAQKEFALFEEMVKATQVTAPETGVVMLEERFSNSGFVKYRSGDSVSRGSAFMQITSFEGFYIKGTIPEEHFGQIHNGQPVEFFLPTDREKRYKGTLRKIGRNAISKSISRGVERQVFRIEVATAATSNSFQPGMAVKLEIVTDIIEDHVLIPIGFIYNDPQGTYVELENNERRDVKVAGYDNDYVALSKGLSEGEEVYGDLEPANY